MFLYTPFTDFRKLRIIIWLHALIHKEFNALSFAICLCLIGRKIKCCCITKRSTIPTKPTCSTWTSTNTLYWRMQVSSTCQSSHGVMSISDDGKYLTFTMLNGVRRCI